MLPDVSGIDRTFVYEVPAELDEDVAIGSIVRVALHGRNVRGWVVGDGVEQEREDVRPLTALVSLGPPPDVVALCRFGAWRYAARLRPFLAAASPPRRVHALSAPKPGALVARAAPDAEIFAATKRALDASSSVLRLAPAVLRLDVVLSARELVGDGQLLVLVPERGDADILARRLSRLGVGVAAMPDEWAAAKAGTSVVVGTRTAVFAPMPALAGILVLDAHAESYVEQRAPTWDANVLATERAKSAGLPCVLVSACPTLVELAGRNVVALEPEHERDGWATLEVVDRRGDDPRSGLFSSSLGARIRDERSERPDATVVCVLNRTGRARLLSCANCRSLTRCERCGAALKEVTTGDPTQALACGVCGATRPFVCAVCGSSRLSRLRLGTARVAEELAALVAEPVSEVSSTSDADDASSAGVVVGTEAVLHRVRSAAMVVFLDFDQELLAPRYRAGEQALVLLARASRLVGGRLGDGRVLVQTRLVENEVIVAASTGDPASFAARELARRAALGLPPTRALAEVSGDDAIAFAAALRGRGLDVGEIEPGRFVVRAENEAALADALRGAGSPKEGVRVAVDPIRL